jgi:hypothetical protein
MIIEFHHLFLSLVDCLSIHFSLTQNLASRHKARELEDREKFEFFIELMIIVENWNECERRRVKEMKMNYHGRWNFLVYSIICLPWRYDSFD